MSGELVIIAVDGSKQAEEAFEWYTKHLHKAGNRLILAHSIEAPSMPTRESWEQQTQAGQVKSKELKEKYDEKLRASNIDKFEWEEEVEKPGEFLCGLAKNKSASYVVMGTRGLGKLRRTIMGSVSDYVVHHCCCPVLVCRQK
ncbi:DgyrCDS3521 [Dimorphilus gyrociliatus]|uniref:DgyrCDS3521 n=2 Tax=Dimorphilus gyrociliatus TaxID=2664684 RepID=A0A7I8VFE4_9ANNE|nr:DgyrCDS3521 [Dimorphilus gyrociliatus]